MEVGQHLTEAALGSHFFVGLSRAMILFIVTSGLSFVLGVLRVPNIPRDEIENGADFVDRYFKHCSGLTIHAIPDTSDVSINQVSRIVVHSVIELHSQVAGVHGHCKNVAKKLEPSLAESMSPLFKAVCLIPALVSKPSKGTQTSTRCRLYGH